MSESGIGAVLSHFGPPETGARERVRRLDRASLDEELSLLNVDPSAREEAIAHLGDLKGDAEAQEALARLLTHVEEARDHPDTPSPIIPDPHDEPAHRRLLYYYLLALAVPGTRTYLLDRGAPREVVESTMASFARHGAIHQSTWGRAGIDAGWWQLLALRGELVEIGRLQYHRVRIARGTFSPSPWYTAEEAAHRGVGFRPGDESVALDIPAGPSLDPGEVDASLAAAPSILETLWPVDGRRLLTCSSWLLDDRLATWLGPTSRILTFQRLFELVPGFYEDDADVLTFVFRRSAPSLEELPQDTTLQRAVVALLRAGGHWHMRCGWRDLAR